jgi:hypothetical protein
MLFTACCCGWDTSGKWHGWVLFNPLTGLGGIIGMEEEQPHVFCRPCMSPLATTDVVITLLITHDKCHLQIARTNLTWFPILTFINGFLVNWPPLSISQSSNDDRDPFFSWRTSLLLRLYEIGDETKVSPWVWVLSDMPTKECQGKSQGSREYLWLTSVPLSVSIKNERDEEVLIAWKLTGPTSWLKRLLKRSSIPGMKGLKLSAVVLLTQRFSTSPGEVEQIL